MKFMVELEQEEIIIAATEYLETHKKLKVTSDLSKDNKVVFQVEPLKSEEKK